MGYVASAEGAVRNPRLGSVIPWAAQHNCDNCGSLSDLFLNVRRVRRVARASANDMPPVVDGGESRISSAGADAGADTTGKAEAGGAGLVADGLANGQAPAKLCQ